MFHICPALIKSGLNNSIFYVVEQQTINRKRRERSGPDIATVVATVLIYFFGRFWMAVWLIGQAPTTRQACVFCSFVVVWLIGRKLDSCIVKKPHNYWGV